MSGDSRKSPFLASSSFWWLHTLPGLWLHHFDLCRCCPSASPALSLLSVSLFIKIHVIAFRAYLDNPGLSPYFKLLNLITITKTIFPIMYIHRFQGFGLDVFFGGAGRKFWISICGLVYIHIFLCCHS